jgi:hypothetical protein
MGMASGEGGETLMEFDVIWNGARDAYLCIEPWKPRDMSHVAPAKLRIERRLRGRPLGSSADTMVNRQARVLARLQERPQWPSNLLRGQVRMSAGDYYRTLMQLRDDGVIEWRHGRVSMSGPLSRRAEEAR